MAYTRVKQVGLVVALSACTAFAADVKKQFRYNAGPGATLNVVNMYGPVTVHPSAGRQVVVDATLHSDKVEVDSAQQGNRIEVQSHILGTPNANDARVDYDIQAPADMLLSIRADDGPIHIDRLRSDMSLEGDESEIAVQDCSNARLRIRTVKGPVTLTNISNGYVDVISVSGNVQMNSVTGRKVTASSTKGNIRYAGDFAGGGDYIFNNHSGDIEVLLPTSASVDLSARSVTGSVENDFPLQEKQHTAFRVSPGRSFAGTSNSGASSVQLRSFSGRIRVKKQ